MFFQSLYEPGPSDEREPVEGLVQLPHACNVSATYHRRPQRESECIKRQACRGKTLHVTNSTHCVEFWGRLLIIHSKPTKNIKCRFMFSLNQQLLFNLVNNKKYPQTD